MHPELEIFSRISPEIDVVTQAHPEKEGQPVSRQNSRAMTVTNAWFYQPILPFCTSNLLWLYLNSQAQPNNSINKLGAFPQLNLFLHKSPITRSRNKVNAIFVFQTEMVSADNLNLDVLELIFAFLSGNDLPSVASVSRSFLAGVIPRLYQTISYRIRQGKGYDTVSCRITTFLRVKLKLKRAKSCHLLLLYWPILIWQFMFES